MTKEVRALKSLFAFRTRLRDAWIDRLWVDLVLVALAVGVHAVLVLALPAADLLGNALPADRRATYSATAVVVSLLGSLSSVAISQLGSAKGWRAAVLKGEASGALARNWRSIFRAGMLSALISLLALLVDPSIVTSSAAAVAVRWIFEAGVLLALVKFLRLSALFTEVVTITAKDAADGEARSDELALAPVLDASWSRRAS
jgi:hypothetical protein